MHKSRAGARVGRHAPTGGGIRAVGNNIFPYLTDPCTERDSPQTRENLVNNLVVSIMNYTASTSTKKKGP